MCGGGSLTDPPDCMRKMKLMISSLAADQLQALQTHVITPVSPDPFPQHLGPFPQRSPRPYYRVFVYYCRTYYKGVCGGGGGQ
jgi:hypothetical protein